MPQIRVISSAEMGKTLRPFLESAGIDGEGRSILERQAVPCWLAVHDLDLMTARGLRGVFEATGGNAVLTPRDSQADLLLLGTMEQVAVFITKLRTGSPSLAHWSREMAGALRNISRPPLPFAVRGQKLDFSRRAYVDAVVNVTPDSFYDGGHHATVMSAADYALRMVDEGADILEMGGESAGPGKQVSVQEELDRVAGVIEALTARTSTLISIDTRRYEVAAAAVAAGAHIVNDTQSLSDPRMIRLVAENDVGLVLMHFPGRPGELPRRWRYRDMMDHMCTFLRERADLARRAGVPRSRIIVDPGIGFHKTGAHDLEVLRRLPELRSLGYAIMLGTSNRGFLEYATGLGASERLEATAATVAYGIGQGAHILRVHNVREMARVVHMMAATLSGKPSIAPKPKPEAKAEQ